MSRFKDYAVILSLSAVWALFVTYNVELAVISAGAAVIGFMVSGT